MGDIIVSANALTKVFRTGQQEVHALRGVNLEVHAGEFMALVGPSGSGKTTFLNLVGALDVPSGGELRVLGRSVGTLTARERADLRLRSIGFVFQAYNLFPHMSVLDNVALAAMFGHAGLDRPQAEREARHWLAFTGLEARASVYPGDLNLHQRKFLELARALASRPSLVFLDEVLSGLTPAEIDDAVRLVREIRAQGATVVFVEHVMRAVMQLTDRVVVLNHGRVIAEGLPEATMREPEVVRAYLGGAHA